jgi:hypothetical protein
MKKTLLWAMAATMIASAAVAAPATSGRHVIAPNATYAGGAPATTNNDDTCDIAVAPAATLLLPYFEVDFRSTSTDALNTIFTITNTSNIPQIAHVTVWTDWSFPVLDFNIFLTGYDVQGVNLIDLIGRGVIPPTSITTTRGSLSASNTAGNVNFSGAAATTCANLPGPIPENLRLAVQAALTTGDYSLIDPTCTEQVGGTHANAIGYITVDVANNCSQTLPTTETYYTNEILYDNVLIGDYQRINPSSATGNYAGGETMVHIRAIPEGGPAGSDLNIGGAFPYSNLPYTFYDRYVPELTPRVDRRQPLPGVFAARYINGGTGGFNTEFAIWREGVTGSELENPGDTCDDYVLNSALPYTEAVRFDEQENPTFLVPECRVSPCIELEGTLPETSSTPVDDDGDGVFPPDTAATANLGGWMYLNLHHGLDEGTFAADRPFGASQNWVNVRMTAEGRYGVDFDAAFLGNGCSAVPAANFRPIGPVGGVCNPVTNPTCAGINTTPDPALIP